MADESTKKINIEIGVDDSGVKNGLKRTESETETWVSKMASMWDRLSERQQEAWSKYVSMFSGPTELGTSMQKAWERLLENVSAAHAEMAGFQTQYNGLFGTNAQVAAQRFEAAGKSDLERRLDIEDRKKRFAELMATPDSSGRNFGVFSQNIKDAMAPQLSGESAKDAAAVFEAAGLTDTEKKLMSFSERIAYAKQQFEDFKEKITKGIEPIKAGFSGLSRVATRFAKITPFANMAQHIKNANKPLQNFIRAFKRVVTYKAIRGGIGAIIQGWKDGMTNLYNYSIRFGTQFHNTMDSLATDLQFIHNGIAAMVAPLLNAVAPAIQAIAQRVVDLANAIGYFFAKILGQASFSAAIRGSKAFQDLGGSAKEAKKQLMGFDELNVLTEPSGGGAAGADYGKMFEEWSTELEEGSIEQRIRDAIESGDWEGLGSLLAEKMNMLTAKFGEGSFGTKLGQKIQKGLDIASGFMRTYDFKQAGAALATNINNIFANVNWTQAGELLARGITAIFDFVGGFLGTLDTGQVASAIGSIVIGWFDHFTEWLNGVDWVSVGQTFFQKVKDFVTNIHFGDIASSFMTFLGTAINSAFGLLSGFFGELINNISEYFKKETEACGGNAVLGFLSGILDALVGIVSWIYKNVVKPFITAFRGKDGLGLDGGDNLMYGAGEDVIEQFLDGMVGIIPKVWKFLSNVGKGIKETFTTWQAESKRASEMNYTPSFTPSPKLNGQANAGFYASGGTVPTGQLFIANEAGPELVGTVGGQTTVTSQDQFTAGMADIMDVTNTVILQAAQSLMQTIQSKDFKSVVQIGDRDIVSAYDRGKTLAGNALVE